MDRIFWGRGNTLSSDSLDGVNMDNLKAGFSRQLVNPPSCTFLAGYEYQRYSREVHDDLFSRAIVIKGKETYVFIALDLVAVDQYFVAAVAERLYEKWGICRENLMLCCTHTHSGPGGTFSSEGPIGRGLSGVFGEADSMMVEYIIRQINGCVEKCLEDMDCFTLSYEHGIVEGVGLNRRDTVIPIDNELQVLVIERNDGRKALIYNYACHPTVLDKYNNKVSADFPGEAAYILEHAGGFDAALFFNGACGDVSTRFTRHSSTFEEMKRIGSILGGEALVLASRKRNRIPAESIKAISRTIELKIRDFKIAKGVEGSLEQPVKRQDSASASLEGGQLRLYQSRLEGEKNNTNLARGFDGMESIKITVKLVRVNDIFFVYIPGELFTSLGLRIKKSLEDGKIFVACYGGGYIGYIPDSEAYGSGGYEAMSSPLAEGEGERLVECITEAIASM